MMKQNTILERHSIKTGIFWWQFWFWSCRWGTCRICAWRPWRMRGRSERARRDTWRSPCLLAGTPGTCSTHLASCRRLERLPYCLCWHLSWLCAQLLGRGPARELWAGVRLRWETLLWSSIGPAADWHLVLSMSVWHKLEHLWCLI